MSPRLRAVEERLCRLEADLSVAIDIINRICARLAEADDYTAWEQTTYRRYIDLELPPYPDPGIAPETKELITCPVE